MSFQLTKQQARVKAFIIAYIAQNETAPSRREIAEGVGLSSVSGVNRIMDALVDRGHVATIPGKARAIRILGDVK